MMYFNQLTNSWESQLQITSIKTIPPFLYVKIVICLEISDDQILLSDYYYLIIIDKDSLIGLNELTKWFRINEQYLFKVEVNKMREDVMSEC